MSTLSVWSPFAGPFAGPFAPWSGPARRASAPRGFVPAAEVTRDGDDAVVRLELPGLATAADVTVDVVGHRLVVAGERRGESRPSSGGGYREVRYGSFRRSFTLPTHVGADAVSASYDAGVLSVRVAGVHEAPETHRVEIAGVAPAAEAPAAEAEGPDASATSREADAA